MMQPCPHRPQDLLPHAPPMVLIDEVLNWTEDSIVVATAVRADGPFVEPGLGVPAHVGIEWMAQACGAFAGLEAKAAGTPVRLGFLLGTRRYRAARCYFVIGERLKIEAKLIFREEGMAVFDCSISADADQELAFAQLTLFQPEDAATVLGNPFTG